MVANAPPTSPARTPSPEHDSDPPHEEPGNPRADGCPARSVHDLGHVVAESTRLIARANGASPLDRTVKSDLLQRDRAVVTGPSTDAVAGSALALVRGLSESPPIRRQI